MPVKEAGEQTRRLMRLSELRTGGSTGAGGGMAAFAQLLRDFFEQGESPFADRAADDRELFELWLLARMPAEFKFDVSFDSPDVAKYRALSRLLRKPHTAIELTPFMYLMLRREDWLARQHDLKTEAGVGGFANWLFQAQRFDSLTSFDFARQEMLAWANSPCRETPAISRLMYLNWVSRSDLQNAFDLKTFSGAKAFRNWFSQRATAELGLAPCVVAKEISVAGVIKSALKACSRTIKPSVEANVASPNAAAPCVIGAFGGEFGVGQHARSVVGALDSVEQPIILLNSPLGPHAQSNAQYSDRFVKHSSSSVNLFCVNAMSSLDTLRAVGADKALGRYNILYGYWELGAIPKCWRPYLEIFDEFWGPTKFIADALSSAVSQTVLHMPISVTVDDSITLSRRELGLPADKFLFLFHFDAYSFARRKNPEAAIEAFKRAFPQGDEPAALVIKTKHLPEAVSTELKASIGGDRRYIFLEGDFARDRIVALENACDAYISLHRAEGFGMGPAEMMCLSKPVIVTNYSGNTDFTNASNSCLVDYRLVPVEPGEYAYPEPGQNWAEPDIDHAAWYMRKLASDHDYARSLGRAAQQYMQEHHNPQTVGKRYKQRLLQVKA